MKWISVQESLPAIGEYVLMAGKNGDCLWRDVGLYRDADTFVDKYVATSHPTHWMPLPEHPEEKKGA